MTGLFAWKRLQAFSPPPVKLELTLQSDDFGTLNDVDSKLHERCGSANLDVLMCNMES